MTDEFKPRVKRAVTREQQVETKHRERIASLGGRAYKFVSPARPAVPDRLNILPIPPEHREIVARYVWFTETKAPGKSPTPAQQREHESLRALGMRVDVVDNLDGVTK